MSRVNGNGDHREKNKIVVLFLDKVAHSKERLSKKGCVTVKKEIVKFAKATHSIFTENCQSSSK